MISNLDEAIQSYEHALRANPRSIQAMNAISAILRTQEQFHKAVDYLNNILKLDPNNGDVWGSLGQCPSFFPTLCKSVGSSLIGHCYLMMDDLQQAYSAYQQALYHLRDPKVRRTRNMRIKLTGL
jgi:tetratricopeptide (TPR) repeat protein